MKRILAISPVPQQAAGYRLRIAQYRQHLLQAGFELDVHPLFDDDLFELVYRGGHYARKVAGLAARTIDRLRVMTTLRRYAAVFLYREAYPIGPPFLERGIARAGVPIVYDFDDAIYLRNTSAANRIVGILKNPGKIATILRLSAHAFAGNRHLAAYARRYTPRVSIIPTSLDTEVWVPRRDRPPRRQPVIGWIGSPTTVPYLLSISNPLAELSREQPFVLRVAGSTEPVSIPGVNVENVRWSLEREVALFTDCDIGVYPMPDDPWTQGKSGLKALQFMACGVPVVASSVGTTKDIITHGVNGLLASSPREWVAHLRRLLTEHKERFRLAEAGRTTVEQEYSLQIIGPRVASAFVSVTQR